MAACFTLDYWEDDGWFVGRLNEIPHVMSQGETLDDLQANIRDAYQLLREDAASSSSIPETHKELAITF